MHQARKRFGQNFLVDHGVIQRIVHAIHPKAEDTLVEIGPGQGAITALLLDANPSLNVVELDRDLIPILLEKFKRYPELDIHEADALKFDFSSLLTDKESDQQLRVVGNLPYNISTPLIFHLLGYGQRIRDMHFMLQKEVVERMAAGPGDKNYGRLSIMCQYFCDVEFLFEVGPQCFKPAPKVDSAIVRLMPREPEALANSYHWLDKIVKTAFQQRRKTLRNALKPIIDPAHLEPLVENPSIRPENLSVRDYVELSNHSLPFAEANQSIKL